MTTWWLAGACLVGAAILVGWPSGRLRARRRAVISGRHTADTVQESGSGDISTAIGPGARLPRSAALDRLLTSVPPWRTVLVGVVLGGVGGALAGGPVAALAVAAYTGLAVRALLRRRANRTAEHAHRRQLDELCALAADLRAGLPPSTALSTATSVVDGPDRLAGLARAAVRLAEETGAPLADLVERIEADARAMDRGLAAAEAQAAGARATAWLLAGLPAGGIALGYGIGVDPLAILLHTPIGAACAVGAIILQLAGLAWAARLGGAGRSARVATSER
ncbi:type II secretion system F family protein [Plantactinospora endophytica]|uniref:Tight adherence protein B n=1 Tax=Plantactinospora endophytica TaxID=673535 RepID=A0ABQ4E855_9ACTN|nr:hypothetical protein [Plantactinospora endophytica]GIG90910.1 hypothetical protein Pen02_58460 [Plantactinospora endophytica]